MMRVRPPLVALAGLALAALACSLSDSPESLPPTDTPAPPVFETIETTAEAPGVEAEFFNLNLSASDQEGLAERAEEIYQRLVDAGGAVDRQVLLAAFAELAGLPRLGGQWRAAGPAPIEAINMPQGQVPGSGRVNAFAIDPRDPQLIYAAASIGGLWKSEDGGQTWRCLTGDQVPLIYGGLVMDPRDPDTLYALLGEFDGQVSSTYGYLANGIMRSQDAGRSWELIGQREFNGAAVTALVFDADGMMYAASGQIAVYEAPLDQPDFGVFRSADGGDTWERLVSCADLADCTPSRASGVKAFLGGFMDLEIASDGTLFASLCSVECLGTRLLRSRDGGASWQDLDVLPALERWADENSVSIQYVDDDKTIPYLEGFEIAVAAADPNLVLAGGGLYWETKRKEGSWSWAIRSRDGGDTWEWLADAGDYCSGGGESPQCTYDNVVEIDPADPQHMLLGGSFTADEDEPYYWYAMLRGSRDGGDTWGDLTPPVEGSLMHPDVHGLAFSPADPRVVWVGGDGGIYRTPDILADPPQWESLSRGLDTLLFIGIGLHPTDRDYLIGGLQDNANAFTTDGGRSWQGASQGDGGDTAVDPFQPDIVYSFQYQYSLSRNQSGGRGDGQAWFGSDWQGYSQGLDGDDSWLFYPPFVLDANTEGVLYVGSNRVYRSQDRGDNWDPVSDFLTDEGAIRALAIAPSDGQVLYAGTTDGRVWATSDGGGRWGAVTARAFPPRGVTDIAIDPRDPATVYVTFAGFAAQTPGAEGHVFRTTDGGRTWEDVSANLPDAPLHAVALDDQGGVYLGGSLGVWALAEPGRWLPYGTGMPYALVSDLEINPRTGILAAGTYGRSAWVIDLP